MSKLYTSIILIATALFLMSNSGGRGTVGGEGVTNAPGETGRTCASSGCHDDGQFGTSVAFELVDESGTVTEVYRAGQNYTARIITSNSSAPSGYGFQMVAVNASGDGSGEWGTVPSETQTLTINGRSYVEHASTLSNPVIEIPWTSPTADEGDVSFYVSANAVNGNGSPGGDGAVDANFVFAFEDTSSTEDESLSRVKVFPNPTIDRLTIENSTSSNFSIFNAQGKLTLSGSIDAGQIDVSTLQEGMYFLQLEQGKQMERFIKL